MNYSRYIKNDYKHRVYPPLMPAHSRAHWTLRVTLAVGLGLGVGLTVISEFAGASRRQPGPAPETVVTESELAETRVISLALPGIPPATETAPSVVETIPLPQSTPTREPEVSGDVGDPGPRVEVPVDIPVENRAAEVPEAIELSVARGDTLSALFKRAGVNQKTMYEMLADKRLKKRFKALRPGQRVGFETDPENRILALHWHINDLETLSIRRAESGFETESILREYESRLTTASGSIDNSLFLAGQKAGLSDNLIMRMVGILGWDIDFALDIRKNDQFTVLYQEQFDDQGEKIRDGRILATEFVNRGRKVVALYYRDPTGHGDYYSPDGHSMRKAFLRTPVNFSRISSRFSLGRRHPVLNKVRAHKGVDYAAPTGTPVKTAGDGKIIFRGRKGGYGRTLIVQHGGKYTTLYAHLSKYARKARPGNRVKQGQTIGYVGKSGLATGPHLHYEFRVAGVHRNPLTIELPKAQPLDKKYLDDFRAKSQPLLARLEMLRRTQIALND